MWKNKKGRGEGKECKEKQLKLKDWYENLFQWKLPKLYEGDPNKVSS